MDDKPQEYLHAVQDARRDMEHLYSTLGWLRDVGTWEEKDCYNKMRGILYSMHEHWNKLESEIIAKQRHDLIV